MIRRTIEEELVLHGRGLFQTVGDSMEPLLHNRKSTVMIEKKTAPLKKYDVALYRRPAGEYVLHRIVKVLDGAYLISGDNRIRKEKVPEEWVIGVMRGYYADERNEYISCNSIVYLQYLRSLKTKRRIRWFRALPGRICRKVFRLIIGRTASWKQDFLL